jgi:hypothetical protein
MRLLKRTTCLVFVGLAIAVAYTAAEDPKKDSKLEDDIIGSWTMLSAKYNGTEHKFPEGSTSIKHVTPTQFMWVTYDKDGKVNRAAGGTYTLQGDKYEETPEYGISQDFDIIKGKAQTFKCRIDGDKWYHDGKLNNGLVIEEVWQRVKKK